MDSMGQTWIQNWIQTFYGDNVTGFKLMCKLGHIVSPEHVMAPCPPLSELREGSCSSGSSVWPFWTPAPWAGKVFFSQENGGVGMCPTVVFLTESCCETGIDYINYIHVYSIWFTMVYPEGTF